MPLTTGGHCPPNFVVTEIFVLNTKQKQNLSLLKIYLDPTNFKTWLRACRRLQLFLLSDADKSS